MVFSGALYPGESVAKDTHSSATTLDGMISIVHN